MNDAITPVPDALDDEPMQLPGTDEPIEPAPFPQTDGDEPPEVFIPSDEPTGVPANREIGGPRDAPRPM